MALALCVAPLTACGSGESSSSKSGSGSSSSAAEHPEAANVDPGSVTTAALKSAVSDDDVRSFYEAAQWQPIWDRNKAGELLTALDQAPSHGLARAMFIEGAASAPAEREAQLTKAALEYARTLGQGRTDPEELREVYTVARPKVDVASGLRQAIGSNQVGQWYASLPPRTPEYKALSQAYLQYRKQAAQEGSTEIESGDLIKPRQSDPRVPRLVEALRTNGYLQGGSPQGVPPQQYTEAMAAAVKRFQNDYGIASDGVIGPDTLQVLNTGSRDRARQLAINLERLRWLERDPPKTRIDVNTAATVLDYYRDGQHRDRRRVVVGQPDWETPQLGSPIFRLVANPTWTVPKSIEEDELADKGPGYFAENNMIRKDGWIVQQPGPENALGQVKLDMQNEHAIYLHDTPAKALFQQNERHRSHGCVRVQNAVEFARMLAEQDGVLPKFQQAMATGEETFVQLNNKVPVRLLYHTAYFDGSRVQFRTDAYGWDEDVARALGQESRERRTVRSRQHDRDVGP